VPIVVGLVDYGIDRKNLEMSLQQLRYFLAAAEHGSFSAAAAALHMAQPSLSDQIRRLEAELGVALFARAGRRLELTEAGRLLRPQAERTLAAAQEAADSVREVRTLTGGTASFGTFGNAPYYLLADLVEDFRRGHPNVKVRVVGLNSTEVAEAVREGRLEGGLIVLPIDDHGLDVRVAIRDELLFLSTDPEAVREPMTIERLATRPLILYDARFGWSDPTRRQLLDRAQRAGLTLEPAIEVEYVATALDLAVRGLGDTIGARTITLGREWARQLLAVPFDPPVYDTFAFITRKDAPLSPATRAFMRLAAKRIEEQGAVAAAT
jgi:DNA-binding transcriptional LysR family regulator